MPVLQTIRKKVEIKLPKSGGKVWCWNEFLAGDYRKIMQDQIIQPDKQFPLDKGFEFILNLIVEWDFIDADGNPVPVTQENLDCLPLSDLNVLAEHVSKVSERSTVSKNVKKNT